MMADPRQLERAAEQFIREIDSASRDILALTKTIREIEQLSVAVDMVDLRNSLSLKSDVSRLQSEVNDLTRNLQALARELSDTNSKLFKALH
jgi:prefoldin subunit 5